MYNLRKLAGIEKSGEESGKRKRARIGEALKESHGKEDRDDTAVVDRPKAKGFSSLRPDLQELILLKTSTRTRLKLFQVNERLREWVFEEGLFSRDVKRIEITYRAKRPREKIVTYDRLRIFRILPRSGLADHVEIDVADAKKSMALKNIRSCRDLKVTGWGVEFRVADFFPNLGFLGTFDIYFFDEARLEAFFEGTSLEVTLAFNVPNHFYFRGEFGQEKLFELIDKYAGRCPSIYLANIPFEGTVEFLKTRKLRFIEYSVDSVSDDREIVEMFLENGIPSQHPDPCVKIGVGPSFMINLMSALTKNDTLVIGDLERIVKKFEDHSAEVGWSFDNSVLESNAVAFTIRFDENKNLIFLLFESGGEADLLIKYEPIEK